MPLSMGIRPEQDPNIYHLLAHQAINPASGSERTQNGIYINYNPANIKTNEKLATEAIGKAPLIVKVPRPKDKGGYVVEQTFKITDIDQFNKKWRAFYMYDGNLTSAFASKANVNTAKGDQSGGEIPKYYKEVIGLINNKYTPGSFKLTKYDETNQEKKLQNATFVLTDDNGKTIFRTSDANGEVNFKDIAPGRYTLEETRPPEGYQLTNKKWQVTVLSDGSVRIRETSITGAGQLYTGNEINIPVSNKPAGEKFRVYKKDGNGQPLPGAKFKITDPDDSKFLAEATSGPNGIVEFEATLTEGKNYILEEAEPPTGYNQLNKKWVLRVEDGKTKVYNYSDPTEEVTVEKSLLGDKGTEWVDVKNRNTSSWSNYDNRWTGWVDNNQNAEHLGTRIIAINKDKKYVIQRYVINPEAKNIDAATAATIHREKPEYQNMDWYAGTEDVKIFTLEPKTGGNTDGKVTGLISDIRLASYKVTEITDKVKKSINNSHFGETRLKLDLPVTNKPIIVDVKVPYKNENGGVGTGMDWREGNTTYWKSDYYERVSDIKTAGIVSETGGTIVGSYVGEDSLDVTNDLKTYGFKIKKVKEDDPNKVITGAVFKLTGPDEFIKEMTTGSNGIISFDGLKPGTYTLKETQPAPGYEKKDKTWTVRVADDGKVYIKENASGAQLPQKVKVVSVSSNPSANGIRQYLANNSASLYGVNTGLQFGPEIVEAALRAESYWETIDPAITTGLTNDSRPKVQTKITEINKKDHRFRQIFLVNVDSYGITTGFDLHRYPEDRAMLPSEIHSYTAKAVGKNSSLENILGTPKDVKLNKPTEETKSGKPNITRIKFATRITTPVLVEIEASYDPNKAFGMGMDFYGEGMGIYSNPTAWGAQSYSSEKLVNKKTYSLTITPSQNGSVSAAKKSEIEEKESLTLTINPDNGYELEQLMVDNNNVTTSVVNNKYPLTMPNHNVTVSAKFKAKTYNITHKDPENGTISVKDKAQYGEDVEVTVIPKDGFKTTSVTMNGQTLTADNDGKYKFKMPADNANISASFTRKGPEQRTTDPVTIKEEIPFEIQETIDNTLKPGEVVVEQTGKKGSVQYKYSITYEKSEGQSVEKPADWPDNAPKAAPQAEERVISYNKIEVEGTRVNPTTQIVRKGPAGAEEGEQEIKPGEAAQITNKQTGLDLKIYKKDRYDRKLEGAIFNIRKTDKNFEKFDSEFGAKKGTSNDKGLVEFKNKDGKIINLPVGYYVIEETAAPLGYRKPNAPWKVQVVEENGQLVAKYKGPKETPQSYVEKNENLDIKEANGVKYATKITHIDTESRSFIQRVYIDTRAKQGTVNVQIKPKHKREEIDRAGLPPVTIKEGVKTAYRSTYKITGINGDPDQAKMIKILNDYDVSNPDVTVVNTARWRPFDWGFDEDQLNLEPGVYYIDIEGFYDTSIIDRNVTNEVRIDENYNFIDKNGKQTNDPVLEDPYKLTANDIPDADLGKIDIDIKFYDGARTFQQLVFDKEQNKFTSKTFEGASYQGGIEAVRQRYEDKLYGNYVRQGQDPKVARENAIAKAKEWANGKSYNNQKYANALSKQASLTGYDYIGGYIDPPVTPGEEGYKDPSSTISTSMDISSLYSSNATNTVPQEGLDIENDAERYNITFSKHGKETDKDTVEEITKRRLEGAVFKLEKRVREGIYEEVEGSYVSSAFNGYFGFRGLEPGRYRLIEVRAPKGYKPIEGPLLHFSVETVSIVSQRITDPRTGENISVKDVGFYFPGNDNAYKFEDLEVHDPVTNEVIKFKDAKNADLETTRIINPLDKTKEVPLRELSIKFPGEIKDKKGKVIRDTYKISEIQITPTSNGYISLEYDKANSVYQYIKENSSTEKDGLLVDYVTSATAKNMGKIVNERPGKGNVTIEKYDENNQLLPGKKNAQGKLEGAEFELTNQSTGKSEGKKTIGEDGKVSFEGLDIGNYKLEEVKSADGHINTGNNWHFTVGGKDLDPYSEDIDPTGRDLSGQIKLVKSDMSVVSPINENGAPTGKGEIHPHLGESIVFDNSYEVPEGIKINPGDYFTLKLKDSTDLHGVFENSIDNLDIFSDGVGTIAKANYNRKDGTITYTFTKYADTYELKKITNKIAAFINLDVIRQSQNNVPVGFSMNNEDKSSKINVVYDLNTERKDDGVNFINYTSKIVKYNPKTGEFVHYFYINRDRKPSGGFDFNFLSDQNLSNVVVTEYKVLNNLYDAMPESFGVDENSNNLSRGRVINTTNYLPAEKLLSTPYYNGVSRDGSYIVKVTGKVSDDDKSKYVGYSHIIHYYGNGYVLYADREDSVHQFVNKSSAEAKLTIKAINPANKIRFKKINSNSEALQGATFQIYKKSGNNWNTEGMQVQKSDKDGLFGYDKLGPGEYKIEETTAPEGYVTPDGPVAEFKVDESGKVYRKESYKDEKGQDQVRFIEEPGVVPITLVNNKEHEVEFKKVDGTDKNKVLEGAEFQVLYKNEKTGEYSDKNITLYKDADDNLYALKSDDTPPSGYTKLDKFTSGKDGIVKFKVNEPGFYALKETKAPKGYITPRGIVKEFAVLDDKVQTEQYKTEMDVKKTKSGTYANGWHNTYLTSATLRFNPNHEEITYVKDKSTISLSGLPLENEFFENNVGVKTGVTIKAYTVDKENGTETFVKSYKVDLKNYDSYKGKETIDLYDLVKGNTTDGSPIKSDKTLVFKMSPQIGLNTELDINSKIVIDDKTIENRTFHIGTKGEAYVEHSYKFTTMEEISKDKDTNKYNPIEVENHQATFPHTGALGIFGFLIAGAIIMTTSYYKYRKKKRGRALSWLN